MKRNDNDPRDVLLPNSGADDVGILPATTSSSSAGAATAACVESASTSVTAGYDSSEEEEGSTGTGGGWFGTGGAFSDFRTLAVSLRETAGGVASVVKTCAINVAAEISLLEDEEGFGPTSSTLR